MFVYLQAYRPQQPDTKPLAQPLLGFVSLFSADAKALETQPIAVTPQPGSRLGVTPMSFNLNLQALAPGEYTCQVTVLDPATSKATFWRAPIVILQTNDLPVSSR